MARLGVSVYPDIDSLDEIERYLRRAAGFGYTRVFSSMFSVEGTAEEVVDLFKRLCDSAHETAMEVSLDVNPSCMRRLRATPEDLSVFSSIGVDILRMDGAYGTDENVSMLNNPWGIRIEHNASALSPASIEELVERGADKARLLACHNFYPQRYTGFRWDRFCEVTGRLRALDIPVGAFVASHAPGAHGVWDATCGLPTVERLRDYPADLQARILESAGATDILFGDAFATDEELDRVAAVLAPVEPTYISEEHERALRHADYIDIEEALGRVRRVRVQLLSQATAVERKILFDFFGHLDMGDSSEWMWRSRAPRMFFQDEAITPRHHAGDFFEVGDVVVVNDAYKHYAGEVQVVLRPMRDDGTRNLVARIDTEEMTMFDVIGDMDLIVFLEA